MPQLKPGLNETTIRAISSLKHEPDWMLQLRLQAYRQFQRLPLPNFGPDLANLDFDNICYYNAPTQQVANRWEDLPAQIKQTYDRIGLPEAEKKYLAGAQAQYNSQMVYQRLKEDWQRRGVIFIDTDTALQQYPELMRQYFGSLVPTNDNKFAALNTAVWSGGSFIYVPPGVRLRIPLQAYFRINIANLGQFERTLIIADENSEVQYVEGCTAPVYSTDSLHAAVVEVIAKPGARVRYTTIQNWSTNVINLTTQRMLVETGALGEWVDGNIGSKITMKYPSVILAGKGARGDIMSLAMAKAGQIQDNGGQAIHLAPHTSSTITSKSISLDGGVCNYRGKVVVKPDAAQVKAATCCDALLMDDRSRSDTFPTSNIQRPDAQLDHEAAVAAIDPDQLFYLTSRGIPIDEAISMIVRGFAEPIVRNLPMEYAVELNRLIDMTMEDAIG